MLRELETLNIRLIISPWQKELKLTTPTIISGYQYLLLACKKVF